MDEDEELPRALSYYKSSYCSEWRVEFDTDYTEYSLYKTIKKWQLENCEGEYDKHYRVSSAGYAAFLSRDDAMLCFLRFT